MMTAAPRRVANAMPCDLQSICKGMGRGLPATLTAVGLRHLAVQNPDGGFAVVMTNPGESRDLLIVHAGRRFPFSPPQRTCHPDAVNPDYPPQLFFDRTGAGSVCRPKDLPG